MSTLEEKLAQTKLLAMDFDGVHTDGHVYVDQNGTETVKCSRRDSLGLNMLKRHGVQLVVISKETNPVVVARCEKLKIECYAGVENAKGKKEILESLLEREQLTQTELVYIGDDLNDLEPITFAGVGVTVADGHEKLKTVAEIVLARNGGEHALRELAERILESKGLPIEY